jgi:CRP-like cAMP-binding protein
MVALPTAALAPSVLAVDRRSAEVLARIGPIVAVLEDIGMFAGATRTALERLAMQLQVEPVTAGTVVVHEGDPADAFYVVRAGQFVATVGDRTVNRLGPDDWFGEIGLLRAAPRTASVIAVGDGVLWRIGGDVFLAAVGSAPALPEPLLDSMTRRTPYGVLPAGG